MKRKNLLVLGGGICILFALFFVREWWIGTQDSVQIFGERSFAVVQTSSDQPIFFGNEETKRKAILLRSVQSYFFSEDPIFISQQPIGTVVDGGDFTLSLFSKNITRGTFEDAVIWFIREPSEEEFTQLKQTSLRLESDFWILEKNVYPDFFPLPSQAILHINKRKPSQKLETFAIENNIPLVTVKETGGFSLEWKKGGWKLETRL